MSTPTIEQCVRAQEAADNLVRPFKANGVQHLLTADELRRVLVELDGLRNDVKYLRGIRDLYYDRMEKAELQRDQWRDLCTTFAHLRRHGDYGGSFSALARFDALNKEAT